MRVTRTTTARIELMLVALLTRAKAEKKGIEKAKVSQIWQCICWSSNCTHTQTNAQMVFGLRIEMRAIRDQRLAINRNE